MSIKPMRPDAAGNPRCRIDWREGGRAGRRRRAVFAGTPTEARAWLAKRRHAESRRGWGLDVDALFTDAAAEFLAAKRAAERSDGYLREVERLFGRLGEAWSGRPVAKIGPREIEDWLTLRRGEGAGARTREKEWGELRTFFRWARRRGHCGQNPIEATEPPQVQPQPPRWLHPAEFARLYETAPDYLRPLLVVLVATGVRVGELCRLRRADVHAGMVYSRDRKGNDWLASPTSAGLRELLLAQPERPDGLVFTRPSIYQGQRARSSAWTPSAVYRALQAAAVAAGLIPKRRDAATRRHGDTETSGRKRRAREHCLGPHILRHTCASWLVAAGVPIYTVRAILGHSTVQMTERYAHLVLAMDWPREVKALPADVSTKCPLLTAGSSNKERKAQTPPPAPEPDFQRENAPKNRNPNNHGRVAERQTLRL